MTIQELKNKAVKITDRMEVRFPQFSRNGVVLDNHNLHTFYNLKGIVDYHPNMHFSFQNEVFAFIDESGNLFAIPNLPEVFQILVENGYKKDNFFVPFGWYEVPVNEEVATKWESLKKEYRESLRS